MIRTPFAMAAIVAATALTAFAQIPGMTVLGQHPSVHIAGHHALLGENGDGAQQLTFMTDSLPEASGVVFEGQLAHPLPAVLKQRYTNALDDRPAALTCHDVRVVRFQKPGGVAHVTAKGSDCTPG